MDNEKFLNRYRIPSARAKWHSYDGGAYFVTICTANHEPYFGIINEGEMHLSEIGCYVAYNLENVTAHYPYAEIPLFVIMPNHLHAVVIIDGNKIPKPRRDIVANCRDAACHVYTGLSVTIGGIKSAVTIFARENHIDFAWQSRFHDHIVRDTGEMNKISDYIENNIARWESDDYYHNRYKNHY